MEMRCGEGQAIESSLAVGSDGSDRTIYVGSTDMGIIHVHGSSVEKDAAA